MSLISKFKSAIAVLAGCVVITAVFAGGIATGCYFYPRLMGAVETDHDDHDHDHDEHDHEEDAHDHGAEHAREGHVKLTEQAFGNLGLTMSNLERSDYWKSLLVPAEIVEIPGRSNLSVSAPISGVVQEIQVLSGEAVGEGTPICRLMITDEALVKAQSSLLDTLSQIDVTETEIQRLVPLTESGAVARKSLIDARYKLQQLAASKNTLTQELKGRGLPDRKISDLIAERKLVTSLQVSSPEFQRHEDRSNDELSQRRGYSIETLSIHPGQTVRKGQDLCDLSYHEELYIQGTAFESDLAILNRIAEHNWSISAEFQNQHASENDHGDGLKLNLLRIDNHVDEETRTVRFYISLPNDVERTIQDDAGRVFQQWQYRPGQRVHLNLPEELWSNQMVVPADAVAVDGPNAMIFAKYKVPFHLKSHDDYEMFIELEPVPVRVLHRDNRMAVIEPGKDFQLRRSIAMNHAHKLHLAMKMQSGGGGDPHAGHSH